MPRMPGAQPNIGGKMDPGTLDTIARQKQFRQQQSMMREQEAASTERAGIAADTAIRSAEIGAGSQREAISSANERAAMQMEADDRRAAEAVEAQEENRVFLEEQQARKAKLDADATEVDHKWDLEAEERTVERAKDAQTFEIEARRDEYKYKMSKAADNLEIELGKLDHMLKTEEKKAKERVIRKKMADEFDKQQGNLDILREDIKTSILSNPDLSYKTWRALPGPRPSASSGYFIGLELNKLGIKGVTAQTLLDYSTLEELVDIGDPSKGGIGKGELMDLGVLTEVLEEHLSKIIIRAPEGENILFYQDQLRIVKKAGRIIHRLERSTKKNVQDIAIAAGDAVKGIAPSAIISTFKGSDLLGTLAGIKAGRTDREPIPDFGGPFADLFFKSLTKRRKRYDDLLGGK